MVALSGDKLNEALAANSLEELAQTGTKIVPPQYSDPLDGLLEEILDSYNWTVIQLMCQSRQIVCRKKSQAIIDLARQYYDENNVKIALAKLSPAAMGAIAYVAKRGKLTSLEVLNNVFKARQQSPDDLPVGVELVNAGLALFAQQGVAELIYRGPQKHESTNPSFFGGNAQIFIPKKIQEIAAANYKLEDYLSTTTLQPFPDQPAKISTEASFEAFIADILALSRYVEQNKARVLQSGALGKRDYAKLYELLRIKDEKDIAKTTKLAETGRLNLLWNVATGLGLIIAKPDAVVQISSTAMQFYELPRYQQLRLMIVAWINSGFNEFVRIPTLNFFTTSSNNSDVPGSTFLTRGRAYVMALLENYLKQGELPEDWIDFESFLKLIQETNLEFLIPRTRPVPTYYSYNYSYNYNYSPGYYTPKMTYNGFDSTLKRGLKNKSGYYTPATLSLNTDWKLVEGEYLAEIFRQTMAWLGAGELGVDAKNRPVAFRLTELGRAALLNKPSQSEQQEAEQAAQIAASAPPELIKPMLVQPNFDLMILAPFQNLALMRQVDRFADQTSSGDVAMYHLSKESILRGLRNGLDGSQILKILNDNSRVPVAQNIQVSIQSWNAEFERVILRPATNLMEVPNPDLLDTVCNDPTFAPYIEKRLGPTYVLLKGDLSTFEGLLQNLLPVIPNANARSNIKKKVAPIYLDWSNLQSGSVKPIGANQLQLKPGYANPYFLYRLGQFADLQEWSPTNQSAVFFISQQSCQRGQNFELTYEAVRRFLTGVLGVLGGVSPAMNLALKGWFGYYDNEPIRGEKAITIQASVSLLNDITAVSEFKNYFLARPTPTTILVKENGFKLLQAKLETWGLKVIAPVLESENADGFDTDDLSNPEDKFPDGNVIAFNPQTIQSALDRRSNSSFDTGQNAEFSNNFLELINALLEDGTIYEEEENLRTSRKNKSQSRSNLDLASTSSIERYLTPQIELQTALEALHSSRLDERQEAVIVLSSLGKMAAREMVPLLYNPDPKVRYNACVVLAVTGDNETIPHLELVVNDTARTQNGTVSEAAHYAIEAIRQRRGR